MRHSSLTRLAIGWVMLVPLIARAENWLNSRADRAGRIGGDELSAEME